ncbi:MAG: glycyl radical protein, partial [Clostridia bacterium]|nr:glycyl radical protein [Clostridia bacterium]
MKVFNFKEIAKSERIDRLKEELFANKPEIESARAVLLTESYKQTEGLPMIKRRSAAFRHILENLPIIIRYNELIVGSATLKSRSCHVFPEYSYKWLEEEFETVA